MGELLANARKRRADIASSKVVDGDWGKRSGMAHASLQVAKGDDAFKRKPGGKS